MLSADYNEAVDELVTANRILFHQGVVDAFGHVSTRDPRDPRHFLLARHVAPGKVTREDILTFDLDGSILDRKDQRPYTELFIHAAIYAARPDVNGIVHSHSHAIIPFTLTHDVALRPVFAVAAFLGAGVARFDTHDVAGDTDLLIRTMELGRALADALGERPVSLMRGHGSVTVGQSVREAVFRAVYTEVNAKLQSEALRLGRIMYLTEGEAALNSAQKDPSYRRTWEFWRDLAEDAHR